MLWFGKRRLAAARGPDSAGASSAAGDAANAATRQPAAEMAPPARPVGSEILSRFDAQICLLAVSLHDDCVVVSPGVERLLGFDPGELDGYTLSTILPQFEDGAALLRAVPDSQRTVGTLALSRTGEVVPVLAFASHVCLGEAQWVFCMLHEMSTPLSRWRQVHKALVDVGG